MTFENIENGRTVATLTADDMRRYRLSFGAMSVRDSATRSMLSDMLSMLDHMGLRSYGDRVTVECREQPDGGCSLDFTVSSADVFRFSRCEDVLAAADAGALPDVPFALRPDGEGCILIPDCRLTERQKLMLSEYCAPEFGA